MPTVFARAIPGAINAIRSHISIEGAIFTGNEASFDGGRNVCEKMSHPTVGAARLGPKVYDQLSSSSEEGPVRMKCVRTRIFV